MFEMQALVSVSTAHANGHWRTAAIYEIRRQPALSHYICLDLERELGPKFGFANLVGFY